MLPLEPPQISSCFLDQHPNHPPPYYCQHANPPSCIPLPAVASASQANDSAGPEECSP